MTIIVIDCGDLDNPSNGQVALSGTSVGSLAIYTCNRGFQINGNTIFTRVCLESTEMWSGSNPTCGGKQITTKIEDVL